MAQNTQTFILVGDFKDNITPKLKKLNRELTRFSKDLNKSLKGATKGIESDFEKLSKKAEKNFKGIGKGFDKAISDAGRSVGKLENSLNDVGRAAGKVRDTVSQIGEGLKGFDGLSESMEGVARAAGRAQDEVLGIGAAAGRANKQADDLMNTLLKAEGLSKMGDAMAQGFQRGVSGVMSVAMKGAGAVRRVFKEAREDEMADIKATSSIKGAFSKAGFKGGDVGGGLTYDEASKFYKQFDVAIAEMIRTSSAPTGKVIELQRLTMDTLGPLLLAAEGVPKGTNVKDITPKTVEKVSQTYGGMLEQIALLSQGTGTATFRVAQGVEQLIKGGKIDTTMDFFTDNVLLMQALQDAGFAGNAMRGGLRVSTLKTEAERLVAFQKALETAQSREGISKMAESLEGTMQALDDTIWNTQVGIMGMGATFDKKEQKDVDDAIKQVYSARIADLQKELKGVKKDSKRAEQIRKDIKREQDEISYLTKEGTSQITTPFKAFNLMFGKTIRSLTEVLAEIGPIWNRFAVSAIKWTDKFLRPLDIAFRNIASDIRGGQDLTEAFGRIAGEIYKFIGSAMGDLAKALSDPTGAISEIENKFVKGFMSAFKDPGSFEKAKKGIVDGVTALITKFIEYLGKILTSEELRPLVLAGIAAAFGPPFVTAVISGATPLVISAVGKVFSGLAAKALALGTATTVAPNAAAATAAALGSEALLLGGGGTAAATTFMGSEALLAGGGTAAAATTAGGANATGLAALMTNPVTIAAATVAALAVVAKITEPIVKAVAPKVQDAAAGKTQQAGKQLATGDIGSSLAYFIQGELMNALNDFVLGFNQVFAGLADFVVGLLSDPKKVTEGIEKIFSGLWRLFTMCGHLILGILASLPGLVVLIGNAVKNLFLGIVGAIQNAWNNRPKWMGGTGGNPAGGTPPSPNAPKPKKTGAEAFGSANPFYGSLGEAINFENKHKPKGSNLVIANDSETIIPAADGLGSMKGVIDAIWRSGAQVAATTMKGFDELRATIATGDAKNAAATARAGSLTKSAIDRSIAVSMAGDAKIMSAIKAASAAGGLGGFGGALGGASGNLQAAAGLARSMGLTMTSYKRNGPPNASYHNVGRAMDFSNSTGPTPQMLKFAQGMAARYGSSMAELIYTPLGFSIKNGKKVAPYAQGSHYNHVHVAFANGLNNPTLFSSAAAAAHYERMMAPAGARVATVTANSSEYAGSGHTTVNQNITINGAQDPQRLAELVFDYASRAAQRIQNASFA